MLSQYGHQATPSASYLLRLLQLQSEAMQDSLLWRISPELGLVLNVCPIFDLPGCFWYAVHALWRTWCHLKSILVERLAPLVDND